MMEYVNGTYTIKIFEECLLQITNSITLNLKFNFLSIILIINEYYYF